MDVTAYSLAGRVNLVQNVHGHYALWIDGRETGTTVELDRVMNHRRTALDTLTIVIEAGRVELRS